MNRLGKFLDDLDTLSRKHGIWIEVNEDIRDSVNLIDENYEVIADGLHNDEDSQEYLVMNDYRDCIE